MRLAREAYASSAQALEACLEHIPSTAELADGTVVPVAADSHIRCALRFVDLAGLLLLVGLYRAPFEIGRPVQTY